jgi:hypothetical protein
MYYVSGSVKYFSQFKDNYCTQTTTTTTTTTTTSTTTTTITTKSPQ